MAAQLREHSLQQTAILEQQNVKLSNATVIHCTSSTRTLSSSKGKQSHGNIHSGAVPPWLRDDDDDDEEEEEDNKEPDCKRICTIGPSKNSLSSIGNTLFVVS